MRSTAVAAYLGKNCVKPGQLPALIASVNEALASLGQAPVSEVPPAVSIRRSSANAITCPDCGWYAQVMKQHIGSAHGLTPDEYRARWGLSVGYPMVATAYAPSRR